MKKFLPLLLPAGLLVFAFLFSQFYHLPLEKNFVLPDLQGKPLELNQFAGQPIILAFFSPRCGDCKEEMTYLEELYQAHQDQNLVVVGIGIQNKKDILDFVQKYHLSFPIVVDETIEVSKGFGVFFLPHLIFLNRKGKIVYSEAGKIPPGKIQEHLKTILQ